MAKLYWHYGAMGSGKSAALLSTAHNYERISKSTAVFTSMLDDRFGAGMVTSRMGISRAAKLFQQDTIFDLNLIGKNVACVLVDESQFCTLDQIKQLHKLAAVDDIQVECFGIRTDFQGNPFAGSAALGVLADVIGELNNKCDCGADSNMNIRFDLLTGRRIRDGQQIQIGGSESYKSSCSKCFYSMEV